MGLLWAFRGELYRCLTARADALPGLADAVLSQAVRCGCWRAIAGAGAPPGARAAYDAVNAGRVDTARLRWSLAAVPLPAWPDGRIRPAVDVCNWLRPDAVTSPERTFCHVAGQELGADDQGLSYSFAAALEPGRTS